MLLDRLQELLDEQPVGWKYATAQRRGPVCGQGDRHGGRQRVSLVERRRVKHRPQGDCGAGAHRTVLLLPGESCYIQRQASEMDALRAAWLRLPIERAWP